MLDSALEPTHILSKNLILLPWILKIIIDMVNDSTPLSGICNSFNKKSEFSFKCIVVLLYFILILYFYDLGYFPQDVRDKTLWLN